MLQDFVNYDDNVCYSLSIKEIVKQEFIVIYYKKIGLLLLVYCKNNRPTISFVLDS